MPIFLRNLKRTYCQKLVTCGEIKTRGRKLLDLLHGPARTLQAEYENEGHIFLVIVSFGSRVPSRKSDHFHVEISFPHEKQPSDVDGTSQEIVGEDVLQRYLSLAIGKKIVTVHARLGRSEGISVWL